MPSISNRSEIACAYSSHRQNVGIQRWPRSPLSSSFSMFARLQNSVKIQRTQRTMCLLFSSSSCLIRADFALRIRLKHFGGLGMSPVSIFNALLPR